MAERCPHCNKPLPERASNAAYPFCSPRCRTIDLGAWLTGDYRIAVPQDETERDGPSESQIRGSSGDSEVN